MLSTLTPNPITCLSDVNSCRKLPGKNNAMTMKMLLTDRSTSRETPNTLEMPSLSLLPQNWAVKMAAPEEIPNWTSERIKKS